MQQDKFLIARTDDAKDLPLPVRMSDMAAGMDLYANVFGDETINGGEIKLVPAGIKISIPKGYEAQIRPRSGLALKHGISMVNTPGTIDADYRGEIKVILINFSKEPFTVKRGDRIAQMVINKLPQVDFEEADCIDDDTDRGSGGFGHTGV